jgi:hypothetical protein
LRNKKSRDDSRPFCSGNETKKPWSPEEAFHGFSLLSFRNLAVDEPLPYVPPPPPAVSFGDCSLHFYPSFKNFKEL